LRAVGWHSPVVTLIDNVQTADNLSQQHGPAAAAGRRNLLRVASAAAAGAAIGALGDPSSVRAFDGDPILIGRDNVGINLTRITGSPLGVYENFVGRTIEAVNSSADPDAVAVYGRSNGNAGVEGVGRDHGAVGRSVDGVGVYGTSTNGSGLTGVSSNSAGVDAFSTNFIDLRCTGTGRLYLREHGTAGAPSTGQYFVGEMIRDEQGNFFVCVTGNGTTAGAWRRIAGPATSGQLHAVDPFRAYDSRRGGYSVNGPLPIGGSRLISVKDAHDDTGVVAIPDVIPVGATAVAYNITVIDPTSPRGFLAVTPGNAAVTTVASVNWFGPGQTIGNASIVKLDSNRQVKVFAGGQAGAVGCAIDVVGYYA
jgi:hypothetical protein